MKARWILGGAVTVVVTAATVVFMLIAKFGILPAILLGILVACAMWFTWGLASGKEKIVFGVAYAIAILAGGAMMAFVTKIGADSAINSFMTFASLTGIVAVGIGYLILFIQRKRAVYGKFHAQWFFLIRFLMTLVCCALYYYFIYYRPYQMEMHGYLETFDYRVGLSDWLLWVMFFLFTIRAIWGYFTPRHFDLSDPDEALAYTRKCMRQILMDAVCLCIGFSMVMALVATIVFLVALVCVFLWCLVSDIIMRFFEGSAKKIDKDIRRKQREREERNRENRID